MSMSATDTPAVTVPFRFFDLRVARSERLGPTMVRVTFAGEKLSEFASGGRDQRFKLFFPHPDQDSPVVPAVPAETGDDWYAAWREMDPAVRGIMRTYTVREQRREPDEIDVDFALHGDAGPASRWARRTAPGDRVTALGPVVADNAGIDFRPPSGADWMLITGDETALPAVAGILAWLPAGTRAKVWIEVPHADDLQDLPTAADAEVTWLIRADGRDGILQAVRRAHLLGGNPYAWIAGEAGTVRALRRHLVNERGFYRRAIKFTGYWRRGASEEDLIEEAAAGGTPAEDD
jgi:NADPH-dependent ferric siderophore reductase